jgi:hypothetical protein
VHAVVLAAACESTSWPDVVLTLGWMAVFAVIVWVVNR